VARVQCREDAAEIEQDTWIEVQAKLALYDPDRASFIAFLKSHAHWKMVEYYRRKCARHRVEILLTDVPRARLQHDEGSQTAGIPELSEAPTPSPECILILRKEIERFLGITFSSSLPPHQLIVFGFAKLLEWRPREVVKELSKRSLRDLEKQLEAEYLQIVPMRETIARECFKPLREKMDYRLDKAIMDFNTRSLYKHLLDSIVGETILCDYYTNPVRPENNIASWCGDVKKRILPKILEA
jgi:DNA-directed RNA polymerase specialized sigma24 family protein